RLADLAAAARQLLPALPQGLQVQGEGGGEDGPVDAVQQAQQRLLGQRGPVGGDEGVLALLEPDELQDLAVRAADHRAQPQVVAVHEGVRAAQADAVQQLLQGVQRGALARLVGAEDDVHAGGAQRQRQVGERTEGDQVQPVDPHRASSSRASSSSTASAARARCRSGSRSSRRSSSGSRARTPEPSTTSRSSAGSPPSCSPTLRSVPTRSSGWSAAERSSGGEVSNRSFSTQVSARWAARDRSSLRRVSWSRCSASCASVGPSTTTRTACTRSGSVSESSVLPSCSATSPNTSVRSRAPRTSTRSSCQRAAVSRSWWRSPV